METLAWKTFSIEVRRRRGQRSHRLIVKPNGQILLTTALSVTRRDLVSFVAQSADWLDQSLAKAADHRRINPPKTFTPGEQFLFLGRPRALGYMPTTNQVAKAFVSGDRLIVTVPKEKWREFDGSIGWPEARNLVRRYYESQARKILHERLTLLAQKMGLRPTKVSYRCQRTRWGSCSSSGEISLNWRLVATPPSTIDYVIIHELAHLRHPNHSADFWRLVSNFAADMKFDKKWLKDHHQQLEFLARPT